MPTGIYKHKPCPMDVRKKISESQKGKRHSIGTEFKKDHKHSLDVRKKISKSHKNRQYPYLKETMFKKGHIPWIKGRKMSEETRKKQRESHIGIINKPKFKETSIELKMEEELKKRNILYSKQVPLCNVSLVDFYLHKNKTVIQCDGCYWHGCTIHYPEFHDKEKRRDADQDIVLKTNGFKVYRFWEHEINKSVKECVDRIFI